MESIDSATFGHMFDFVCGKVVPCICRPTKWTGCILSGLPTDPGFRATPTCKVLPIRDGVRWGELPRTIVRLGAVGCHVVQGHLGLFDSDPRQKVMN